MKKYKLFSMYLLLGALIASSPNSFSQIVTRPVGFFKINALANSDSRVSIPMTRAEEFVGVIDSISGDVITVKNNPGFASGRFVFGDSNNPTTNTYFALISSGVQEGLRLPIIANGDNTLTVEDSDRLTGVVADDKIEIAPYWTPATLFADSDLEDETELLIFNNDFSGINLSPSTSYQFFEGFGWFEGGTNVDNTILHNDESFILRNNSTQSFKLGVTGSAPLSEQLTFIPTLASNVAQDVAIAFAFPEAVPIGNSGLGQNLDELLIFDNTMPGMNKGASFSVQYFEGFGWFDGGTPVDDTLLLEPGAGYIYRKAATDAPEEFKWAQPVPYLQ